MVELFRIDSYCCKNCGSESRINLCGYSDDDGKLIERVYLCGECMDDIWRKEIDGFEVEKKQDLQDYEIGDGPIQLEEREE